MNIWILNDLVGVLVKLTIYGQICVILKAGCCGIWVVCKSLVWSFHWFPALLIGLGRST